MTIWASSDHHVGNGGRRDPWTAEAMREWVRDCAEIAQMASEGDHVVLCGDVLEMWAHKPRSVLFGPSCFTFFRAMVPCIRAGGTVWYVVGNHDDWVLKHQDAVAAALPIGVRIVRDVAIGPYHFLHGHQADAANSDHRWIGRLVTGLGAAIGTVSRQAYGAARDAASRIEHTGRNSRTERHREAMRAMGMASGLHVVCGHSHSRWDGEGVTDCGKWAKDGWVVLPDA